MKSNSPGLPLSPSPAKLFPSPVISTVISPMPSPVLSPATIYPADLVSARARSFESMSAPNAQHHLARDLPFVPIDLDDMPSRPLIFFSQRKVSSSSTTDELNDFREWFKEISISSMPEKALIPPSNPKVFDKGIAILDSQNSSDITKSETNINPIMNGSEQSSLIQASASQASGSVSYSQEPAVAPLAKP